MTSETTNLPTGGSDSARPAISLDDAAELDFYDPSEDNEEVEQEQQSEVATDEAEEGQETDDSTAKDDDTAEAEAEGTADEAATPEPKDDVTVTVNGQPLALSELKAGYQRQQDYTRKTQELGNKTRDLEGMTARVTNTVNAIADFLVKQIPEAPDPSLAMTNPGEYVQKKAMHDAALVQVNTLLASAGDVKAVAKEMTSQQRQELLASENAKLAGIFPSTSTDEGRKTFFDSASVAARELGYSEQEIASVTDHRMFALAHYARIGMQAEQAKAKAKQKVASVPPVAPQKRQQGANVAQVQRNKDAVKRLARTGSIDDAVMIDFD